MDLKSLISFDVPFRYTLSLFSDSAQVICKISYHNTNSSSLIKTSLSINQAKNLQLFPTCFLPKVVLVSPDHSRVFLNQGLRGGGCCSPRGFPKDLIETIGDIFNLKLRSKKERDLICDEAVELSRVISLSMRDSTFDRERVKKLYEFRPCNISSPIHVASRLLQNIENDMIWNGITYIDERGKIVQLLRRLMLNTILGSQLDAIYYKTNRPVEDSNSFLGVNEKLSEIEKIITKNELKYAESMTLICVQSLISYKKNSIQLFKIWNKSVLALKDLAYSLLYNSSYKPKETFINILSAADEVLPDLSSQYFYYFIIFDALEYRLEKFEDFDTSLIKSFLEKEIEKQNPWQFQIILIEHIMTLIYSGAFDNNFSLYLLDLVEEFSHSQEWRIRERCAYVLRTASGMDNTEIREKSFGIHERMKDKEDQDGDERVKIILALPLFHQGKTKAKFSMKFLNNIKNYYDTFIREPEIKALDQKLKESKMVVLSGFTGIGKTRVAIEYVNRYKHSYDYIAFFNCENEDKFNISISECALNITNSSSTLNHFSQVKKFLNRTDCKILVIFDDCLDVKTIREFLIPDIYKIITSKKNQWEESKMQVIDRLTTDDSISLLKLNIYSSISDNNYKKLAKILNGWPLAIKIMSGEIKHDKQIQDEYIDKLPNVIISKEKIKEKLANVFNKLDEDTQVLLGFIWFCEPGEIPASLLQSAFSAYGKKDSWWKAVGQLENFYIAEYNDEVIDVHNKVFKGFEEFAKIEYADHMLNYINSSIVFGEKQASLENKGLVCRHGLSIIEKYHNRTNLKIEVSLKISSFYIKENFDNEKVKLFCNEIKKAIDDLTEEAQDDPRLSEFLIYLGSNFANVHEYLKSKECLEQSFHLSSDNFEMSEDLKLIRVESIGRIMSKLEISDEEAIRFYKKYLRDLKKKRKPDRNDLADVYKKTARLYLRIKNFKKADKYYGLNLEHCENGSGFDHSEALRFYLESASQSFEEKNYENAIEHCNKAIEAQQRLNGLTSEPFLMLGQVYEQLSTFRNIEEYLSKSQYAYRKALHLEPVPSKSHVDLLLKIGDIHEQLKNYKEAIEFYNNHLEEHKKLYEKELDHHFDIYKKISLAYENLNDFISAISYRIKSMKINKNDNENLGQMIEEYSKLCDLYRKVRNFEEAKIYSEKILEINKQLHGEDHLDVADAYFSLGKICVDHDLRDEAYKNFKLCKNIRGKLKGLKDAVLLGPLECMSEIAVQNENYSKAIKILMSINEIWEQYSEKSDTNLLSNYVKIGDLYKKVNNFPKAIKFYEEYKKYCKGENGYLVTDIDGMIEELKKQL